MCRLHNNETDLNQTNQTDWVLPVWTKHICMYVVCCTLFACISVFLSFCLFACVSIPAQVTWSACNGSVETHSFRSIRILSVGKDDESLSLRYLWLAWEGAVTAALISLFFSCLLSNLSLVFLSLSRFPLSPLCIWIVSLSVFSFIPPALRSLFEC